MGQIVLSNVTATIGAITIGTNCIKSVTINFTPAVLDNTGMGHTAKSRKIGLQDWSIDIEIYQDYLTTNLDADLWGIINVDGSVGAIDIAPDGVAVGPDHPHYKSTAGFLESYSPLVAGAVGDLGIAKLRILSMGALLSRAVA
jgi:hypothetical protein